MNSAGFVYLFRFLTRREPGLNSLEDTGLGHGKTPKEAKELKSKEKKRENIQKKKNDV